LRYLRLPPMGLFLAFILCGCVHKMAAGKYQVADQEYSSQNYNMQRTFGTDGGFEESHVLDRCLLLEMSGKWVQKGGTLSLSYRRMRNRRSCRDSLPEWGADSTRLTIPVRNVDGMSFESLLAASGGRPEKWLKWIRLD
jgi:hypothetical protein